AAGHVVDKEGLVRGDGVDAIHVLDGFIRLRRGQVPAGMADVGINRRHVAEQVRLPLAGVAPDKPVEVLKAHADRPLVERPVLAGLEGGYIVVLAEPRGAIAVVLEDAANRCLVAGDDAVVAGEAGGLLGDHAEASRMMVAPGNQGGARRRTQRRRIEIGVAKSHRRDPVERRRRYHPAEGTGNTEAGVISHDQQDVRCTLGRLHAGRPVRRRLRGVAPDLSFELWRWWRKLFSVDRCGRARRARRAGCLLGRTELGEQRSRQRDHWLSESSRSYIHKSSLGNANSVLTSGIPQLQIGSRTKRLPKPAVTTSSD